MKGLYARGKSVKNRYGGNNFSYNYKDKSSMKSFIQSTKNRDIDTELSRYLQYDTTLAPFRGMIKKLIPLKFKETLSIRPYNVFVYKCLYTDEIIPMGCNEPIREISSINTLKITEKIHMGIEK